MNLKLSWPIIKWIDSNLGGRPLTTLLQRGGKGQRGIPKKNLVRYIVNPTLTKKTIMQGRG